MFALTIICVVLYVIFRQSTPFADFFNKNISFVFRWIFAKITGIFPFSLVEFLLFFLPVILVYAIYHAHRAAIGGITASVRFIAKWLAVGCLVFCSFVLMYSPGYFSVSMAEKTGLDTTEITKEELAETMNYLVDEINSLCENNSFLTGEDGATYMPDTIWKTAKKICTAYDDVNGQYDLFHNMKTTVKPIILSPVMTYTHISGLYSYYTGEVNINTNYPDYVVVSTIAHELAHQRGIAPEDEASFAGYLALISSDDPYLRYSGYLDVYTYISSALYKTDKELWRECSGRLCSKAQKELSAYSAFFDKYRDSTASKVSDTVNNAFLQSQGTPGTISYDLVTELVVAYTVRGGK